MVRNPSTKLATHPAAPLSHAFESEVTLADKVGEQRGRGEETGDTNPQSDPSAGMAQARFFFFGSLMDPDVQTIVVGRREQASEYVPARLPGFRRLTVFNETYPALVEVALHNTNATFADGYMITLRSQDEIDRVLFFESDDYEPSVTEIILNDGSKSSVTLCAAKPTCRLNDTPWDFARWQTEVKPRFLPLAQGYMAMHNSDYTDDEIEAEWQRLKRLHQV